MKLQKGDQVQILAGKDKGKKGKIIQIFPDSDRIVVEGVNKMVKHLRAKRENEGGQRVEFDGPFRADNAALICSKCNKPTRIGYKFLENKKKTRTCKKCKQTI
ncbi:50S ribosomal protein L24 [Patescibacteria group bacterium]|nr:50S ribosomal protein L24 [Patescibacteria group bacterium]MBU1673655.1 50S ribosomal protein L24 [Patescibacteria group bacterium]MBU1963857.1 50S ribosomal protein L24 [Patescibacteria group bacterium]